MLSDILKAAENPVLKVFMKTKILLILSLFVTSLSFAQVTPSFGVRAGILSSGIRGDAPDNLNQLLDYTNGMVVTKDHTGFFAGVNADIPVSENFSIEPGLYYSQKGYEINGHVDVKGAEFLGINAKAVLQTQYIDVPLLLKGNFGGLQAFAGPQLSYLSQANLKTSAGVLGFNLLNKTLDATEQLNRWDAAITGGIGYQFDNGVNIMASYDYGLMKADASKNMNAYNRVIKLGVGIRF